MAKIVSLETPIMILNLGLSCKEMNKSGEKVKPELIPNNDDKISEFWSNIDKYVSDENDKTLYILGVPFKNLNNIPDSLYDKHVFYVPSKSNALSEEERRSLNEKYITVTPERGLSDCFIGRISENMNWIRLGEILAGERLPSEKYEFSLSKEFIKTSLADPKRAIEHIANNDMDYFIKHKDKLLSF